MASRHNTTATTDHVMTDRASDALDAMTRLLLRIAATMPCPITRSELDDLHASERVLARILDRTASI